MTDVWTRMAHRLAAPRLAVRRLPANAPGGVVSVFVIALLPVFLGGLPQALAAPAAAIQVPQAVTQSTAAPPPAAPTTAPTQPARQPAMAQPQPPGSALEPPKEAPAEIYRITLRDGQVIRGRILAKKLKTMVIGLGSGGQMTLPRSSITRVEIDRRVTIDQGGNLRFRDPNRTRYMYGPSAFSLKQGECYFSQKELFFSAVACGIHDNVTMLVGSAVPLLFGDNGLNVIVAVKAAVSIDDDLRVAAGFETFLMPAMGGFGFAFANITYGTRDAHVSVAAGTPIVLSDGTAKPGRFIVTLAGNYRVAQHLAVVSENWFFSESAKMHSINGLAVRFLGESHAVDLGLIFMPTANLEIPLPWLDYTFNF